MSKIERLKKLSTKEGIINALAIDQRGALRRMLGEDVTQEAAENFKKLVSENLTEFSSSILLDPEYGLTAVKHRHEECGLLMAYEKTGYDKQTPGRLPDLLPEWSVKSLKELGADGIKLLVYVDVDENDEINLIKDRFIERVGSECVAEELPLFLEILTYDKDIEDEKGVEFAKVKPRKVIEAMKRYSDPRFNVDVLKVEVPVNMNFVEGYGTGEVVYTTEEARKFFKEQSECTNIPFIFLSAGVSPKLFRDTLSFAKESGSKFNGILCGRATWAKGAETYNKSGEEATVDWLKSEGKDNIIELSKVVNETATAIKL